MTGHALSGGEALMKKLEEIARKMGGGAVSIGFMEGATYPDGTPVAAVAFWNEFGKTNQVARPFFRRMIAKESPSWPGKMAALAKSTNYDGARVLAAMGKDIEGALQQSINEFTSPGLKQGTIDATGFSKPLIDTGHMLDSVTSRVDK